MTFTSRTLLILGSVLLIHACYSAQEFSALASARLQSLLSTSAATSRISNSDSIPQPALTSSSFTQLSSLPLDIALETIISVALLCVAIVLGSEELKPISWRVWAGDLERKKLTEGNKIELGKFRVDGYDWLEEGGRMGFVDIRKRRREFAEWVKGGGDAKKA